MDEQKVDLFVMTHQKYFPAEKTVYIKEKLLTASDSKFNLVQATDFKEPTTTFLVSLFLGGLGIDRFMLGDTGMGILKLLTGGLCGILWLIDIFTVANKTKELNFQKIMTII